MFRIGVCDDEAYFRKDLKKRLKAYFESKQFKSEIIFFERGRDLLKVAEKKPFDLAFLDIEMPDMDGVAVGQKLRRIKPDVFLIFVTSHHEYVTQAFRLGAFQYLEKPLNDSFFKQEMERVVTAFVLRKQDYVLEYKGVKTKIPISQMVYLESSGWNVLVHTKEKDYKIVGKLSEEEIRLLDYYFIRIHQSYLVNMKYIKQFYSEKVILWHKDKILPVSRKYKDNARCTFLEYQRKVGI